MAVHFLRLVIAMWCGRVSRWIREPCGGEAPACERIHKSVTDEKISPPGPFRASIVRQEVTTLGHLPYHATASLAIGPVDHRRRRAPRPERALPFDTRRTPARGGCVTRTTARDRRVWRRPRPLAAARDWPAAPASGATATGCRTRTARRRSRGTAWPGGPRAGPRSTRCPRARAAARRA